jgi:glycosyltransferase involved in cell wall biosynthesis
MPIATDELSANAKGGTEQMKNRLAEMLDPDLLDKFQIICSRIRDLDENRIRLYWLHDLPDDPEVKHLESGGWNKFEKCIFVSQWQMEGYIRKFNLPWYKSIVLQNAIIPFDYKPKTFDDKIKLIYHTTPHRGLELLVPVFLHMSKMYDNLELNVYSSFEIYGWSQRDEPYKELFDLCRAHPNINYHGYQPNEVVREALQDAHIFAYPSIWQETSCIALLEAMSAGCLCVHPNYAALPETSANFNLMYQWDPNPNDHVGNFAKALDRAIHVVSMNEIQDSLKTTRDYINHFYSWDGRIQEWNSLLNGIIKKKNLK